MSDPVTQRPSRIVVDLSAVGDNLRAIRARVGVPVMGIVKANAYGHGLVPVARHLEACGVDRLGVAFVEEGIALRRAGIRLPILVLGGIFGPQVADYLRHDLEITVSSLDKLRQVEAVAEALGQRARVHLKIDTGMERIGVHSYSCAGFIEAAIALSCATRASRCMPMKRGKAIADNTPRMMITTISSIKVKPLCLKLSSLM